MDYGELFGILVLGNKPMPYNRTDKKRVQNFIDGIMNLLHYKKDVEGLKRDQQMQRNLAETVEVGLFRFIGQDDQTIVLDYMNEAVRRIFAFKDDSKIGTSDVFLPYMDESCVKSYLIARDVAIENTRAFKWTGAFIIEGKKKWLRFNIIPGHLDDKGFCWEGSVTDVTTSQMKCFAVNQIREQLETMIKKDTYTGDSILALLDDLKTTINQ